MYEVTEIVRAKDTDGAEHDRIFFAYDRTDFPLADTPAVDVIEAVMAEIKEGDPDEFTWGQVGETLARVYGIFDVTDSIAETRSAF